jgi:hypothetical protein
LFNFVVIIKPRMISWLEHTSCGKEEVNNEFYCGNAKEKVPLG